MISTQELARQIEATTPDKAHGQALVGWALYEDEEQASLFALNSFQAAKWLVETPAQRSRTITPVYSDTWHYGAELE